MVNGKSVCVFLGSSNSINSEYEFATQQLARSIANSGFTLIYGGSNIGLMGLLANEVLNHGGAVVGVITKELMQSQGHTKLTAIHVVETMQARKQLMTQLADFSIVLPGGLGTMEELFEFWNALKLNIHSKPIGLLNVNNYYSKLVEFIQHCSYEGFLKIADADLLKIETDPNKLIMGMTTLIQRITK